VYWGNPVNDGYGGFTYDAPVEISCRWEDKSQLISNAGGETILSRAVVFVLQDLDWDGLLWLGELTDLTVGQRADPKSLDSICVVKRFEKTPGLASTTVFLRKAFLTPLLGQ
jgi:hypothetical protein